MKSMPCDENTGETLRERAGHLTNEARTCEPGDTGLTQRRSRRVRKYPATPEQRGLIAMCVIFGADTPTGHRCSTLGQQLKNFATATGPERANLIKLIEESMRDLHARHQ